MQSVSVGTPNACAIDATRLLSPVGTAQPASSARAAPRDQAALATASSARAAPRDRISRLQRVFVAPRSLRALVGTPYADKAVSTIWCEEEEEEPLCWVWGSGIAVLWSCQRV